MSFQDIKGQDITIQILKEHIRQARLSNGYLFVGPEGIGKKMAAKTLAKALNCQNETLDSCDECTSCLKIEKNQHPDVHIIDANSNTEQNKNDTSDSVAIKISHIRQLQKDISLKPYEGKLKVFIIDNAHNLTAEASNALLKTLEEPPAQSLIILVSAKPTLLFKTIISRCQVLKFYPMARPKLEGVLKKDYSLESNLSHFLAYFCEGRIGCALRLKDTDIMRDKNRVIDQFCILRKSNLESLPIQSKENLRNYLNILAGWFRDIYLIKIGMPYLELINLDRKSDLLKFIQSFSFLDLDEIFNCISNSLFYIEQNINIRLLLVNLSEAITYGARSAT